MSTNNSREVTLDNFSFKYGLRDHSENDNVIWKKKSQILRYKKNRVDISVFTSFDGFKGKIYTRYFYFL